MDLQQLKIDREAPRQMRRKRRWVGPVIVLLLLLALGFLFQRQILGFVDSMRLPEVRVAKVVRRSGAQAAATSGTSSNGYIVARTRAALSADTPGRIVELNVREGSVVKKGDIVARLFADEYAAALKRADADLVVAEAGLSHARADVGVSQQELEQARAGVRAAEAGFSEARTGLEWAQIDFERAKTLLEGGVGNQERLDRAKNALDAAQARMTTLQAQVESARSGVPPAEARVSVSNSAVVEAQARVESAKAARDLAQATLDKTNVRAPFDGIVVLKDAEVGEVVSPNSQGGSNARGSVATMVDFATLEVQAEVPETNLASVQIGAPAQIYLDAYPDQAYAGRVDRVWPTANRSKATVEVRVVFEKTDERMRPEMGARVVFLDKRGETKPTAAAAESSISIPSEAIVRIDGADSVFVLERDIARVRRVTLSDDRSGQRVVKDGLSGGELLVLAPPTSLVDGQRVRIAP